MADAISHKPADQESDVECGLVVLIQWQTIHSLPSRAGRIGPRKLDDQKGRGSNPFGRVWIRGAFRGGRRRASAARLRIVQEDAC